MSTTQVLTDVRNFIIKNEVSEAIELLMGVVTTGSKMDELVIQSSKLTRVNQELREGIISLDRANIIRSQITKALLEICHNIQVAKGQNIENNSVVGDSKSHFLHQFPRGPMVEGYLIDEKLPQAYAKLIRPKIAMSYIEKANKLRKDADLNDETVTILEPYTLLSPLESRPFDFWLDAFHEARLHGPRMLAALLHVLPEDQFNESSKDARRELLMNLINHK